MADWGDFISSVIKEVERLKDNHCPDPFFRGHGNSSYKLEPAISRERDNPLFHKNKEKRLYWDFRMQGGHLMPNVKSGWDVLFYMQHHGLPTRLLDWTTSFANALYFALKSPADEIAIWVLNPYALNQLITGNPAVSSLNMSFKMDYHEFIDMEPKPAGALAISGDSKVERIHSQNAAFTLHGDLNTPLEQICSGCLKKFTLSSLYYREAEMFLELAGVNDFSVFPDLDGLARYLQAKELAKK